MLSAPVREITSKSEYFLCMLVILEHNIIIAMRAMASNSIESNHFYYSLAQT